MSKSTRARSILRRLGIVLLIALGVTVLLLEIVSRVADSRLAAKKAAPEFDYKEYKASVLDRLALDVLEYGEVKRAVEQTQTRTIPHPYLGYALRPGFKSPSGAAQQSSHNSLGLRNKETTWEKPAGVFRIVTTGGSSVYGQSESCDDAVWSARLETYLNAARPGQRFEVINTGVPGWSTFEMLINLEQRALDLAPDLVIVYEAINDMRCALYTPGGPVERDNLHWRTNWPVDRPSRVEQVLASSRTYLVWRRYFTNYTQERVDLGFYAIKNYKVDFGPLDPYLHAPSPLPEAGFANYRRNLSDIVSVCHGRGAKIAFATQALPRWHLDRARSRADQIAGFERIQALQREVAEARGATMLESAAIVEAACAQELEEKSAEHHAGTPGMSLEECRKAFQVVPSRDLYFKAEVHPNDRGSDLLARTIADLLLASDLVPE